MSRFRFAISTDEAMEKSRFADPFTELVSIRQPRSDGVASQTESLPNIELKTQKLSINCEIYSVSHKG